MPTVKPFHVHDAAEFDAWMRVSAATVADQPYALVWSEDDVRNMFEQESAYVGVRGYVCLDDGDVVGWALMDLPLADNTSMASVSLGVPPGLRGRGYGTLLVEAMAEDARTAGRTIATTNASWPQDAETSPARRFAEMHGLTLRNTTLHQVLDLPADDDVLDDLERSAQVHHAAYGILAWTGRCPAEWVDEYCALRARMNLEAPLGELELEAEAFDAARLAEEEERIVARNQMGFTAVAVGPDKTLAGFTMLVAHLGQPRVDQWDTLVLGAHRGHRLGLALKIANLRAFRDSGIVADRVHTWNATTNAPMIAINDMLGFHPVKYTGEFQGPVPSG